jgi:hypothetical protein
VPCATRLFELNSHNSSISIQAIASTVTSAGSRYEKFVELIEERSPRLTQKQNRDDRDDAGLKHKYRAESSKTCIAMWVIEVFEDFDAGRSFCVEVRLPTEIC